MPPFTQHDLESLGYTLQPDGSYARAGHRAAPRPDGTYQQTGTHHFVPARLPNPQPQPPARPALGKPPKGESPRQARVTLCITRSACALLDADNFAGGCKPLIDQLRYAKLISDDDPETVEILFRQEKVRTKAAEMTTIEITQP
jgi:hypothetical protein